MVIAIKVTDNDLNESFSYESAGDLTAGRRDALVYTDKDTTEILAINELNRQNGNLAGRFRIDDENLTFSYILGDFSAGDYTFDSRLTVDGDLVSASLKKDGEDDLLNILYDTSYESAAFTVRKTPEGSLIEFPGGEETVLAAQDDLTNAAMEIYNGMYAEESAHNW